MAPFARARINAAEVPIAVNGPTISLPQTRTSKPATLWLVRYDPRTIQVAIRAGENGGRTIPHRNIVRDLVSLGTWNGEAKSFKLPAGVPGLKNALLLQAGRGGPIVAATRA